MQAYLSRCFFETSADLLANQLSAFWAQVFAVVVFAPVIEEFAKAYPIFYRHGETQKSIFTLGFLVGLGFGIAEFLEYVLVLEVPFYFRVQGIFFHAANASITAYGIATRRPFQFYLAAVTLHFANNLFATLGDPWLIGASLTVAFTYVLSWQLYRIAKEEFVQYELRKMES